MFNKLPFEYYKPYLHIGKKILWHNETLMDKVNYGDLMLLTGAKYNHTYLLLNYRHNQLSSQLNFTTSVLHKHAINTNQTRQIRWSNNSKEQLEADLE